MAKEKSTDLMVSKLLDMAGIQHKAEESGIKEIDDALKTASKRGTKKVGFPEFVGKSGDFILVIEDKKDIDKHFLKTEDGQIDMSTKAITDYAVNGAVHYVQHIVDNTNFQQVFAFGVSGDEKHHKITPVFINKNIIKILDDVENFQNFSEDNIVKYYKEQVLGETPTEVLELQEILKKSAELHEYLRNYGQLGDKEKPLVVSALLLALREKSFSIDSLTGDTLKTDGQKIYDAISTHMTRVDVKPESKKEQVLGNFVIVKNNIILNEIDERLGKTPLKFFTEFLQKNVYNSITQSNTEDILGRFYGEFMRYTGGDGQSLGIVLTPAHITELFADLVDIKPSDIVFDPCCGTGGFLVAAMHKMIEQASNKDEINAIKKNRIYGIEIKPDMFSIATTNMILRGDGKSNLVNADFLKQDAQELRKKNYSVGFINPPYSMAKGKDTSHLSEINFIKHLLDSLGEGARCAAIVPQSTMVGKTKEDKQIKEQILKDHTLEGVITLNKDTFYGVGTNPCIVVFTAHKSHQEKKYCKFINFEDDGFVVRKHIGLVETERSKERKAHLLDCRLHDAPAESKFMVKTTIEADDERLHSFYYFNDEIPKEEEFEKTIADYLTFEFGMIAEGREYLFSNDLEKGQND